VKELSMNTTANTTMNPAMELALCANFGSAAGWRTDALSLMRCEPANGAALQLVFHPDIGSLSHQWLLEQASPAAPKTPEAVTLLRLTIDPTTSAEEALDDVDWNAVYALYQAAVHDASAAFAAEQGDLGTAVLLDVRRAGMFEKSQTMIPNAQWRDPALVSHWAQSLPRDQPVIVYCIYGHEVGRTTAMRLCAAGVNARYLSGGIDAWQAAGLPLVPRP
jgi:superoxide dismutase, Fe-Mn family